MRVHHLNLGTFCPYGGHLMDGVSKGLTGRLVTHCLLVETDRSGLVLVDTGIGTRDIDHPVPRLSRFYLDLLRPVFEPMETAVAQIRLLDFRPEDVRHIVLTHLDFDHAGGLEDFPWATVHVFERELEAARHRTTPVARGRYRPKQWNEGVRWQTYRPGGERWLGFEAVRGLAGLPPEILLVPLIGHTWGHCGVAVESDHGWLFDAGDAYFYREELRTVDGRCTPGLEAYQMLMQVDRRQRHWNQERVRQLYRNHPGDVRIFCSHDQTELAACQAGVGYYDTSQRARATNSWGDSESARRSKSMGLDPSSLSPRN